MININIHGIIKQIEQGEFVVIYGGATAGKTSILRDLNRKYPETCFIIRWDIPNPRKSIDVLRALTEPYDVYLLDEPTASLDLGYQIEISLLLKKLSRERNMTLVVATHDLNMAASLCENLVLMHNGKILAQGLTQEVLTADMVRQLYGVEASVKLQSETGDLLIVPVRRKDTNL